MKEFYEENLAYLFPCYEIQFVLTKDDAIVPESDPTRPERSAESE
jgi:hypothetical protein